MTVALKPVVGAHLRECCDKQNLTRMLPAPRVNDMCLACGAHWYGVGDDVTEYTRRQWDALMDAALDAERTHPKEGEEVDIEFSDGHTERAVFRCGALFTAAEAWGLDEHPFRLVRSNA